MKYIYDIMIKVILALVLVLSMVFGMKNCVDNKRLDNVEITREKVDSLQKVIDSLSAELFIQTINNTRYEIALDNFKEKDSVLARKFEYFLYTETE
jgi:hypothetical protein